MQLEPISKSTPSVEQRRCPGAEGASRQRSRQSERAVPAQQPRFLPAETQLMSAEKRRPAVFSQSDKSRRQRSHCQKNSRRLFF